jgi:glycosyltransferase involved in cell wall biosynthesis
VLHVGNVANNAYLNAKLLRAAGVECDVLAYAHYHIMGCPEWEDSDFRGGPLDEDRPDWGRVDLGGFTRPRWFAHGPFGVAAAYLAALRGMDSSAERRWRWLSFRRQLITSTRFAWLRALRHALGRRRSAALEPSSGDAFPGHSDHPSAADLAAVSAPHGWTRESLRRLFGVYDLVHAYGAEPILPLAAGFHPYVAFEHGTLRVLPFEPSPLGRLTALAYRAADQVVITNADNRAAAERLGITRYRFVPHPVSEYEPDVAAVDLLRRDLRQRLNADFIVFHPSRQHWHEARDRHLEKGNDRLIDGLARLFRARPRAAAVFVAWGQTLDASRARLAAHGVAERVLWIDPVPGPALARYMSASEIVADQFYLGSFGSITPRALFLGVPPLLHLDEAAHRWCFPELPPVVNGAEPGEICAQLTRLADNPAALHTLGQKGRDWYRRHHSSTIVQQALLATYADATASAQS